MIQAWTSWEYVLTPFPNEPITDEQFMAVAESLADALDGYKEDPSVSVRNGILTLAYSAGLDVSEESWRLIATAACIAVGILGTAVVHLETTIMNVAE
jgi:hypothetical protein